MRIDTVQNLRVTHWGNTGPARIAPPPQTAAAPAGSPQPPAPAIRLPYLQAFALPEVDAPEVDVDRFLDMTAALLKRMDQVRLWLQPPEEPSVDFAA